MILSLFRSKIFRIASAFLLVSAAAVFFAGFFETGKIKNDFLLENVIGPRCGAVLRARACLWQNHSKALDKCAAELDSMNKIFKKTAERAKGRGAIQMSGQEALAFKTFVQLRDASNKKFAKCQLKSFKKQMKSLKKKGGIVLQAGKSASFALVDEQIIRGCYLEKFNKYIALAEKWSAAGECSAIPARPEPETGGGGPPGEGGPESV